MTEDEDDETKDEDEDELEEDEEEDDSEDEDSELELDEEEEVEELESDLELEEEEVEDTLKLLLCTTFERGSAATDPVLRLRSGFECLSTCFWGFTERLATSELCSSCLDNFLFFPSPGSSSLTIFLFLPPISGFTPLEASVEGPGETPTLSSIPISKPLSFQFKEIKMEGEKETRRTIRHHQPK